MNMYGWKINGDGRRTLIASTGTDTIGWVLHRDIKTSTSRVLASGA